MAQGGNLHLERLRQRAGDFDPDVRDRLLAGNMLPASWVEQAQRFRRCSAGDAARLDGIDVIIARQRRCGRRDWARRRRVRRRRNAGAAQPGMFTQPFSFIGLPVVAVPLWLGGATLPIGVQLIAAPWREDNALRAARQLEKNSASPVRPLQQDSSMTDRLNLSTLARPARRRTSRLDRNAVSAGIVHLGIGAFPAHQAVVIDDARPTRRWGSSAQASGAGHQGRLVLDGSIRCSSGTANCAACASSARCCS